ncbi:hypothetical protein [Embleya sp. NPDC020886]|uniref:hypothetical protein n=1 Tax=Embleya sp. NPDC020886 TaxID=3363980 RepID=UPI0037A5B28F
MGWFGRFQGDFYFEEVVGEGVIPPTYTDDGVVPDAEIHDACVDEGGRLRPDE